MVFDLTHIHTHGYAALGCLDVALSPPPLSPALLRARNANLQREAGRQEEKSFVSVLKSCRIGNFYLNNPFI